MNRLRWTNTMGLPAHNGLLSASCRPAQRRRRYRVNRCSWLSVARRSTAVPSSRSARSWGSNAAASVMRTRLASNCWPRCSAASIDSGLPGSRPHAILELSSPLRLRPRRPDPPREAEHSRPARHSDPHPTEQAACRARICPLQGLETRCPTTYFRYQTSSKIPENREIGGSGIGHVYNLPAVHYTVHTDAGRGRHPGCPGPSDVLPGSLQGGSTENRLPHLTRGTNTPWTRGHVECWHCEANA